MKKNLAIIGFLMANCASAQTHRFIYEFTYKLDSTSADVKKANMTLDVNPENVKFYPYQYAQKDSLNKLQNSHAAGWNPQLPAIIRKKNTFENLNLVYADGLFSYKTIDQLNWKLSHETKKIGGYSLQKATAHFGGRHWTAWFCKDINLNEGPYKFRGLPGLIFEVSDSGKNFSLVLLKSWKLKETYDTSEFLESFAGQKAIPSTEQLIQKKQLEYFNDPLHKLRENFDPKTSDLSVYGVKVTSVEQFKELTKITQNALRKQYNPIELDKAIKYPKN